MKLLIIGINYAPEETGIAPYTTGMARHLAGRGHQVTVMTGVPHYPDWRTRPPYGGALWREEWDGDIRVLRSRHFVPARQSALQRGLYEASFLISGLLRWRLAPDAVLAVVPTLSSGLMARMAASRLRVPYGVLFQDLMGRAADESGVAGGRTVARVVQAAERWAVEKAAGVGVIASGFTPYVESLGVLPDRIFRLRNWVHMEPARSPVAETRARFDLPQDAFVALHAGNMGHKQGLGNVIEAARIAQVARQEVLFLLVGNGNQRAELERRAQDYGLNNLRFLPVQPKEDFADLLAAADVLLLNQRASISDMALPSKLTSYFCAGRPVLAAVSEESEAASEIRAAGAGIIVAPERPGELVKALLDLRGRPAAMTAMGESGRAYASSQLSAETCLAQLESFVESILGVAETSPARERVAA